MKYNILLNDIAQNIVCSSFNRDFSGVAGDNIFSTANYMIASINKPAIALELLDLNNSSYTYNSVAFINQLPEIYELGCDESYSLFLDAVHVNNKPIGFIQQIKENGYWPHIINNPPYSSLPVLGTKIGNSYRYNLNINSTLFFDQKKTIDLRILASPIDNWGTPTDNNGVISWSNINLAMKMSPWTTSTTLKISIKDCN